MPKKMIKIGNAQAFWGDSSIAASKLIEQQPDLDYLTLDYLAEVSMSILAIQREKNPSLGYARDFVDLVKSLIPFWKKGLKFKIVTNAGGLNPKGCAQACHEVLQASGLKLKIGIVSGDDITGRLKTSNENSFNNLDTQESIQSIKDKIISANAYFGSKPIVEALKQNCDIVVSGRIADPSMTLAPCVAEFNWSWEDYDKLASGTIAGHLIECGTQVTGGISTNWLQLQDNGRIGFPVIEMYADGKFIVTKPKGTGGAVTFETVKEQLLYEIGDPDNYISPDVAVSFLSLELKEESKDRIQISGAKGKKPPVHYKVSATYRDGFKCDGQLTIFGNQADKKAQRCGEILIQRCKDAGYHISKYNIECLGALHVAPNVLEREFESLECVLRVSLAHEQEEVLNFFSKEIASMVTCGPPGTTGYTSGRPKVRPVFGYWPCLVSVDQVKPVVEILEVANV